MAYDKSLAQMVSILLEGRPGFNEKKMFGGVCFLLHGNMACGVLDKDLIVRVGPQNYEDSLTLPHTRPFDFTGRPMKGWVVVSAEDLATEEITSWVERGVAFALTLPAK